MRVFVTGSTGFTGQTVVKELIEAGHSVLGLSRSEKNDEILKKLGADVHRGSIEDLDSLKSGAAAADGVIHLAFIHDFTDYMGNCAKDRQAIEAMGNALAGSNRPLIITSGTAMAQFGRVITEDDGPDPTSMGGSTRGLAEPLTLGFASKGVRAMVIRIPLTNHGEGDHGFVPLIIQASREKGEVAYVGDGQNRWSAVHRLDTARVYRLALEKGVAGSVYHAVGDEAIPFKEIAGVIAKKLDVPMKSITQEEAGALYGFVGNFVGMDNPASNKKTQEQLGWAPTHPTLLADLESGVYTKN